MKMKDISHLDCYGIASGTSVFRIRMANYRLLYAVEDQRTLV